MKDTIDLTLAAEDFLVVLLFAVGLFFVARMVARENRHAGILAFLGGALITFGGFFKALWKFIQAVGGSDFAWLNNSLFVLMSAGFVCLAWALWRGAKKNSAAQIALVPIVLTAVIWSLAAYFGFVKESRAWFFILLGATVIFNLWLSFQLIFRAWKNALWLAVILFAVNLICILSLSGISDQTMTLQWIKQIINTFSQAAFALAAWLLYKSSESSQKARL